MHIKMKYNIDVLTDLFFDNQFYKMFNDTREPVTYHFY